MFNLIGEVSRLTDKLNKDRKHKEFIKQWNKEHSQSKLIDHIQQTNN